MKVSRIINAMKGVGTLPALLVVLLVLRVGTAAAVECQHELTDAARATERAQTALRVETLALGGELCLVEDGLQPAQSPADTAHGHDGPHLNSPCPFFKSPITLTGAFVDPATHDVSFSRLSRVTGTLCPKAKAPCAAYSPRAPPLSAQG